MTSEIGKFLFYVSLWQEFANKIDEHGKKDFEHYVYLYILPSIYNHKYYLCKNLRTRINQY